VNCVDSLLPTALLSLLNKTKIGIISLNCRKIGYLYFYRILIHLCCVSFLNAKVDHLSKYAMLCNVYLLLLTAMVLVTSGKYVTLIPH